MISCTNYKSSSWCYNYIIAYDMFPLTYIPNIVVDLFPTTTKTGKHQNVIGKVKKLLETSIQTGRCMLSVWFC